MSGDLVELNERIQDEYLELARLVSRIEAGWERAKVSADDLYLDGVALNLHGFYSGLEKIFELIATAIDNALPQGANWHKMLLNQMAAEVPSVRPPVISVNTRNELDEYRGFRHVVRNVYSFRFDPARLQNLMERLPVVFDRVRNELDSFLEHLGRDKKRQ